MAEDKPKNRDRLVRTQRNALTGSIYYFYDCREGSDMFEPLEDGVRYVVATPETGEWKGFSRRNSHKDSAVVNMHPYARWAESEQHIMRVKALADRMSQVVNHLLNKELDIGEVEALVESLLDKECKSVLISSEEE